MENLYLIRDDSRYIPGYLLYPSYNAPYLLYHGSSHIFSALATVSREVTPQSLASALLELCFNS